MGIHPVIVWGVGWAAAVGVAAVAGVTAGFESLSPLHYVAAVAVGAVAFGVPMRHGARAMALQNASAQGLVWLAAFAVAALVLGNYYSEVTGLAKPGDLNINTTETMRQRSGPQYPTELVFSTMVITAFATGSGVASGILAGGRRILGSVFRGVVFGVACGVGTAFGLVLAVLAVPILGQLLSMGAHGPVAELLAVAIGLCAGGFVAGCGAGAVIEAGRRLVFRSSSTIQS